MTHCNRCSFYIFLNDFKNIVSNQFAGANSSTLSQFDANDQEQTTTLLPMLYYCTPTTLYCSAKMQVICRKRLLLQLGLVN